MDKINFAIMKLFKSYLVEHDSDTTEFAISNYALKKGICISNNCPKNIIDIACELWGKDGFLLNQTFHKSFSTIINSSEEDLICQQLFHYLTTYGFEDIGIYNENLVYIPNEKLEIPELNRDIELIKITEITKEMLKKRLLSLCQSSIPLSKETIEYISELTCYMDISKDNIETIKNKEMKTVLYQKLNILPKDPNEFLRYLIYILIGRTLIIKDKLTIQSLKMCDKKEALRLITLYNEQYNIKQLAEIFNRYKPLFLALKSGKENYIVKNKILQLLKNKSNLKTQYGEEETKLNTIINKISHLSKKYHKPMKKNDLDVFIKWCIENQNQEDFNKNLKTKIEDAGIWRAIKLQNYLQYKAANLSEHVYKIRNGKVWIHEEYKEQNFKVNSIIEIIENIIINTLKNNVFGKKIYLDDNFDLVLPQSEKQFVGNIPFGSSLIIDKENLLFGIQWYNVESERVDLDLKIISNDYTVGWNSKYNKEDKLIFSGDVTDAPYPNGATECIYVDELIGKTMFSMKINNYTTNVENVQYDIIIAKGNKNQLKNNYIINPNDIILKIPKNKIEKGKSEHSIGTVLINDDTIKLIFTDLCTSNRRCSENNEIEDVLRKYLEKENQYKSKLKNYLKKAGAILVSNIEESDINLGINELNKDSLINLFK